MNKGKIMSTDLRQQCNLLLSGHFDQHQPKPSHKWLNGAKRMMWRDTYGDGDFIEVLKVKVADLLRLWGRRVCDCRHHELAWHWELPAKRKETQ